MVPDDQPSTTSSNRAQIKICGLTRVAEALACLEAGVDAIGLVFYPPSPRFVLTVQAAEIAATVSQRAVTVGVFVDEAYETIMRCAEDCQLQAVQLHGQESPALVRRLRHHNLTVIKTLFHARKPMFKEAADYDVSAFLLECGRGRLPGGNAESWPWQEARRISRNKPVILAGGLNPANVSAAIHLGLPDAVDVSSGVESAPGRKDRARVKSFIQAVAASGNQAATRRVF
jgi:phosphoribosylanthranilate isomerase/indole-3-glycerol phosphate synthase/phosphoribosylanthranilate isomerase